MLDPSQFEPVFDRPARQDIRECVRAYKTGEFVRAGGPPVTGVAGQTIHVVRATEFVRFRTVGKFQIQFPQAASRPMKGAERDGPHNDIDCYVHKGLCFENVRYLAVEVCGASDATFEIIDPTLFFFGEATSVISVQNTGQVEPVSGEELTVGAAIGTWDLGDILGCQWYDFGPYFVAVSKGC